MAGRADVGGGIPVIRDLSELLPLIQLGGERRVLPWRPAESASCQQVQVDMKHRLSGVALTVQDRAVPALGIAMLFGQRCCAPDHGPDEVVVARSQVVQRRDVLPRNDEDMKRRLRTDVLERDQILILVDEVARDLASDDLAEQAVAHRR